MTGNATASSAAEPPVGSTPRSPARVMGVVEALALRPDGLSLADLSRALDLPKTSLFNLLHALERDAWIVNRGGAWRLGTAAIRLGAMISSGMPSWRRAGVLLPSIAARFGETALLAVPTADRQEVLYVDIADGPEAIRFATVVGTRRPLYSTAAGHVVLAWSDEDFLRAYLAAGNRRAFTPRTTTDRQALRKAIETTRRSGVAETRDQMVVGVWACGAPVFDAARNLVAAVMIAAPTARGKQKRPLLLSGIRAAGEEMSRILGLAGDYVGAG